MSTHIVSTFLCAVLAFHDKETRAHWAGWGFSPVSASGKHGDAVQLLLHFRALGACETPQIATAGADGSDWILFHISTSPHKDTDSKASSTSTSGFRLSLDEAERRVVLHLPAHHRCVRDSMSAFLAFLYS